MDGNLANMRMMFFVQVVTKAIEVLLWCLVLQCQRKARDWCNG